MWNSLTLNGKITCFRIEVSSIFKKINDIDCIGSLGPTYISEGSPVYPLRWKILRELGLEFFKNFSTRVL